MRNILIFIIGLYRRFISPLKPQACRFFPSCSQYACEALRIHGAFVGLLLTVLRLLRCNPYCKSGYDPPPPKGKAVKYIFSKNKVKTKYGE